MAIKGRFKNLEWNCANDEGRAASWETVQVAVLMDIRDELQQLNSLLGCPNFIAIPAKLERLRLLDPVARMARRANTNAAKRRKAAK